MQPPELRSLLSLVNNRLCSKSGFTVGRIHYHPPADEGSGTYNSENETERDFVIKQLLLNMVIPVTSNDLPLASQHLRHYLTGTGEPVSFPEREHLKQMEKTIGEEMGELARFAATIHERGKLIAFSSTKSRGGYFPSEETKDLFYAVGGYQIWLDGQICVKDSRLFEANVTLHVYDRYNWDKGKCVFFHLPNSAFVWMVEYCVGNSGPIRVDGDFLIVEDEALGRLHRQGLAREFDITGSVNLSVSGEIGKKTDYTQTTSVDGRR